jgi:hypothetical protein
MKSAENLLRALTRAILGNPDLEPRIEITDRGRSAFVVIDTRPFDPAPLIGTGGTMKLAMQAVLAGCDHPDSWKITFSIPPNAIRSPKLSEVRPDVSAMKSVMDAAVNHWSKSGSQARAKVETSDSAVIAIVEADDRLADAMRAPLSRIARAIGKANGYGGTVLVNKIKHPVG